MKKFLQAAVLFLSLFLVFTAESCDGQNGGKPESSSGVKKATAAVPTNPDGLTSEQQNIIDRYKADNQPGAIKHLYVISPYSGQVILYSTVKGKVTSGSKRLTPNSVHVADGANAHKYDGFSVKIGGGSYETGEVLGDDGTYGGSSDYLYWWDSQGRYHQHYLTGGQIVHVSSEPLNVKSVTINLEQR